MIQIHMTSSLIALLLLSLCSQAAAADDARLFEQARIAHLRMNWQAAADLYERVKTKPLAQAAICYRAHCLAELGEYDHAIGLYRQYLHQVEDEHYRGETMLELARSLCLSADQPASLKEADQWLQNALVWAKQQPGIVKVGDDPGNNSPLFIGPQTVLHAGTTPWYLPRLTSKILLLRIYVATSLAQPLVAKQCLDELKTAGSEQKPAWVSAQVLRTLDSDLQRGHFLLPRQTWDSLSPEHAPAIRLASFYCQAGETALARSLLLKTHGRTAQGASLADDWAACEMALAAVEHQLGQPEQAIKRLRLFTGVLRATSVSPLRRWMLANALAGDKRTLPQAYQLYADMVAEVSASPQAEVAADRVLLSQVIASRNQGDSSAALRALDKLQTQFSGTESARLAGLVAAPRSYAVGPTSASPRSAANRRGQEEPVLSQMDVYLVLPANRDGGLSPGQSGVALLKIAPYSSVSRGWVSTTQYVPPLSHPTPPADVRDLLVVQTGNPRQAE